MGHKVHLCGQPTISNLKFLDTVGDLTFFKFPEYFLVLTPFLKQLSEFLKQSLITA
jgi:hypothetical protein